MVKNVVLGNGSGDFDIHPFMADDFFERFTDEIREKPADKIRVSSMAYNPHEESVQALTQAMQSAALYDGSDVLLTLDARVTRKPYALLAVVDTPLLLNRRDAEDVQESLRKMQEDGVRVAVVNRPKNTPSNLAFGRSHIKEYINGASVYLGGPNISATERQDVVVGFRNNQVSDWLIGVTDSIARKGTSRRAFDDSDICAEIGNDTRIVIDAGVPGQSKILEDSLGIIDNADEFIYVGTQYFPTGALAEAVRNARERNVEVIFPINHPSKHDSLQLFHWAFYLANKLGDKKMRFFQDYVMPDDYQMLHSTMIASEKEVSIGSHNFVDLLVRGGTAELNLFSSRPSFVRAVKQLVDSCLRNSVSQPR